MSRIKEFFHRWNKRGCPQCGGKEETCVVKDTIQGIAAEVSICCEQCGAEINYWAYGAYLFPHTILEIVRAFFVGLKRKLREWV